MIKISKQNNSLIVEGIDNAFYINNGDNSYPLNSLIVVTDNSDMATFRSVATNDVLFSGLINNITINGEAVTKDNIIQKFDAVSNSSTGGGTVDAYTKEEADNKFSTKDELTNVQTVANDADTKVDALTTRVEGVETSMNGKQDTLVSGTNIKTINNESVLGEGNIEVSGGIKTYEASEVPSVLLEQFQRAVVGAINKRDYDKYTTTDVAPISQFLSNLSYGDYIKLYEKNDYKIQLIGNTIVGTDTYYYFNIIIVGPGYTKIYSNYITVTVLSSQIYVGTNNSVEVARITDIPNTDNFATKNELTAVETVANNADAKADAATSRVESVETSLGNKQDILVSGTNIKTINSQSILGSGDLTISGVSAEQAQEIAKIPTLETELAQKANVSDVPTVQTDNTGTNKNYIYSNFASSNHKYNVISALANGSESADKYSLLLRTWGPVSAYDNFDINAATTTAAGVMSAADKTKLDSISNEWTGTQAEYDALTTKDNNTIYYVTE